jgi:hypothetical protein
VANPVIWLDSNCFTPGWACKKEMLRFRYYFATISSDFFPAQYGELW